MQNRKLIWQIFPSFLVIVALSLVAVTWIASTEFHKFHNKSVSDNLVARANLFLRNVTPENLAESRKIDDLCKQYGKLSSTRITVILPDGTVIGDTKEYPSSMDNHANRPEFEKAISENVGESIRRSDTLNMNMMYVAVPVIQNEKLVAVVRTSMPLTSIENAVQNMLGRIIIQGIIILLVATILCYMISRRISRPLEVLKDGASRFSDGDFDRKLNVKASEELSSLAEAMNSMAQQLNDKIQTLSSERNEKEAVLSSMIEGVLAIDSDERIIQINRAAATLLDVDCEQSKGRLIYEIIRNPELQKLIGLSLESDDTIENDILLRGEFGDSNLQVIGTQLKDAEENRIGVLIVLNDITRLKKLETIRRDFVANVSHEIRTPVTSIKGFVETLIDGAMDNKDEATRFLNIIERQTNRLNAIIDDLLSLSRLEGQVELEETDLHPGNIHAVIKSAIQSCEHEASAKGISVILEKNGESKAIINPMLLEQAVVNLLMNAIKYSDENSQVQTGTKLEGSNIRIFVKDFGCGISAEHLPRLFERFYRVDKARSRELGGTGLGLAIVKHIAQVHGGSVYVESIPGKGSEFSIIIPSL